ncbi:Peptidyl-prolyl cis-trans isomerase FKBP13 [Picochlorum sp. SENEW3]|nr:Peptidyl-prolyl cis-trans isomerase FKBP13 [Picochlorum sp. SENEW3]
MKLAVLNSSKVSHGLVASNPSSSSRSAALCVGAPKTRVLHIPQAATTGHDVHRSLSKILEVSKQMAVAGIASAAILCAPQLTGAALADACPTMVKVPSGDASGLEYCDVKVGEGDPPVKGTFVKVHYEGRLDSEIASGTFDSSYERGRPLGFSVGTGTVIKGWDLGILGDGQTIPAMKPGGKRKLVIPSELGYGPRGAGGVIPPNATLYFDVEYVGRLVRSGVVHQGLARRNLLANQSDNKTVGPGHGIGPRFLFLNKCGLCQSIT